MECGSCFETYDLQKRVPRNLKCGHTYCEYCVDKIVELSVTAECPSCRLKLDPYVQAKELSKNYVALELAQKQ